ncbi:hypothetical protein [Echinicola soli]|uniref:hypothetical protein n=1 Tax=Echinicola soli TaxID=2591634 RepID=UPI00143DE0A5|nr:hypothetical protein [Echinicola soli]
MGIGQVISAKTANIIFGYLPWVLPMVMNVTLYLVPDKPAWLQVSLLGSRQACLAPDKPAWLQTSLFCARQACLAPDKLSALGLSPLCISKSS